MYPKGYAIVCHLHKTVFCGSGPVEDFAFSRANGYAVGIGVDAATQRRAVAQIHIGACYLHFFCQSTHADDERKCECENDLSFIVVDDDG